MSADPTDYSFHDIALSSLAVEVAKRQEELSTQLAVFTNRLCLHYSATVALQKELLASDKTELREIGELVGVPVDLVEQIIDVRTNFHHTLDVKDRLSDLVQNIENQLLNDTPAGKAH